MYGKMVSVKYHLLLVVFLFVVVLFAAAAVSTEDHLRQFCRAQVSSSGPSVQLGELKTPDEALVQMLNTTNTERLQRYLQHHLSSPQLVHRADRHVCLLTRLTPEIYSYAKYSYFIHSVYAHLHNYVYFPLYTDSTAEDYAYHRKLQPLLEAMEGSVPCDYVFWMDADWIPLDLSMTLETFFASSSSSSCANHGHSGDVEPQLWMSQDVSTTVNTGSILLRITRWTRQLLRNWISLRTASGVTNEQLGFDVLYQHLSAALRERICVLPSHVLNSVSPPMKTLVASHKVMHLAAEDNVYRTAVLQEVSATLCEHIISGVTVAPEKSYEEDLENMQWLLSALPSQLGLKRERLQLIGIDIYGQLQQSLQLNITQLMQSTQGHVGIDLLSRYRTVASKYCFALVYQHNNEEFLLSLKMRSKALQVFTDLVKMRYLSIVQNSPQLEVVFSLEEVLGTNSLDSFLVQYRSKASAWKEKMVADMPELVKLALEVAYEYVRSSNDFFVAQQHVNDDTAMSRMLCGRSALYNLTVFTMPRLLQLLANIVHRSQVDIVLQMQTDFQRFQQQQQQLTVLFDKHCPHLFSVQKEKDEL